jgi:hypothetical protein
VASGNQGTWPFLPMKIVLLHQYLFSFSRASALSIFALDVVYLVCRQRSPRYQAVFKLDIACFINVPFIQKITPFTAFDAM